MKTLILALAALGVLTSSAMATGTIKTGPYVSICKTKPKACGAGYDPLTRPHIPTAPPSPK